MISARSWEELKKQLRPLQGKAIFELERHSSLNDGKFLRVLHQVKAHEIVFYDGKQTSTLAITEDMKKNLHFLGDGFSFLNCKYTLLQIMEG